MRFFEMLMPVGSFDVIINIIFILLKIAVVLGVAMVHIAYATYFERKVIGHIQVRMGPMEVGPHGLLQPLADGLKLFFKEDIIPANADKPIFYMAPVISFIAALSSLAVIPFFSTFVIADINIGLLFVLAMSSIGAYGIVLAGWASNSKYAFLGSLRSSAQVVSYEVAMGLSLVGVMMMSGSLDLREIVIAQQKIPYIGMYALPQIIGLFVFTVAAFAETNRTPFDLPEAENELVAGYFTEYSGFRFALFFLGEYGAMIVMSSLSVVCFFGGWTLPPAILAVAPFLGKIPGVLIFAFKVYVLIFIYYWVRATVPRYRYDQLMSLGWKVLMPLAILNIVITGIIKVLL